MINSRFEYINSKTIFDAKDEIKRSIIPSIVILGAQKSGTTSLANYLDKHPSIYMTKPLKETGYFIPFELIKNNIINQGIPVKSEKDCIINYSLKSYKGEPYILDASTYYTMPPTTKRLEAIKSFNTALKTQPIKFLYIIRNPYLRLISHYSHLIKRSKSKISFEDFIKNQSINPLVISSYASRILEYKSKLKKFDCQLIFFEDILQRPQDTMNIVYSFLNIERIVHEEFKQFNKGEEKGKKPKIILTQETKMKIQSAIEEDKEQLQKHFPDLGYPSEFMRIPNFFQCK